MKCKTHERRGMTCRPKRDSRIPNPFNAQKGEKGREIKEREVRSGRGGGGGGGGMCTPQ